jgi:hypothetical protein
VGAVRFPGDEGVSRQTGGHRTYLYYTAYSWVKPFDPGVHPVWCFPVVFLRACGETRIEDTCPEMIFGKDGF